jgi:hypothetical protein
MSNNFTIQQQRNLEAKQRLNNEHQKLNGAENTEETVGYFTKHNKVFQILAVLFSAVGVYFDLLSLVGIVGSLAIGLAIGLFLEFGKDRLSKGIFNTSLDDVSRYGIIGGTLFIIMLIALLLHIRSINNFTGQTFQKETNSIYQDEVQLRKDTTAINLELAKALNNGTNRDDIISAGAIKSNNITLLDSKNSKAKDALLRSLEENKNTIKGILYLLFISVEFFSLFGIFGNLIIQRNTDKNVKSLVTTADKIANAEANVYLVAETALINNGLARIQHFQQSQNEEAKAQIAFNANMPSNAYNPQATRGYLPSAYIAPTLSETKPQTNSDACSPSTDDNPQNLNKKTNVKSGLNHGKNLILDLMKYNYVDSQIILASWDNGSLGVGDKLVKKPLVLAELEEHGIKEDDYVTLFRRLKKQKLVRFDMGYFSLCELHNITSTKAIG